MSSNQISTFLLLLLLIVLVFCEQACICENKGICVQPGGCQCLQGFLGERCQIYAHQLLDQPKYATLTSNFTHFYFQPDEINYYRLTFNICMVYNPSLLPSLFYIETEKNDGSLRSLHSLVETAKLDLGEKGCTSFSTHYISVKRRENDAYRRIVVGLKAIQKNDETHYLNVYSSQKDNKNSTTTIQKAHNLPYQFVYQRITVKMKYEKYIQNTYYGNFIVISTATLLVIIFAGFLNYLRKRYRSRVQFQDRLSEFQEFDISRFRYHSHHHNPQQQQRRKRKKIECIQVFMPVTRYGQKSCYFMADSLTHFEQVLQREKDGDCCSICLKEFQQREQIRTTPCKHQYHRECIDNWCGSKLSCPVCRRPLDFKREIRKIYLQFLRGEIVR